MNFSESVILITIKLLKEKIYFSIGDCILKISK